MLPAAELLSKTDMSAGRKIPKLCLLQESGLTLICRKLFIGIDHRGCALFLQLVEKFADPPVRRMKLWRRKQRSPVVVHDVHELLFARILSAMGLSIPVLRTCMTIARSRAAQTVDKSGITAQDEIGNPASERLGEGQQNTCSGPPNACLVFDVKPDLPCNRRGRGAPPRHPHGDRQGRDV